MIDNYHIHKRNVSDHIKNKTEVKNKLSLDRNGKRKSNGKNNKSKNLSIIHKSVKKGSSKFSSVYDLSNCSSINRPSSPFFAFGNNNSKEAHHHSSKNYSLALDKIIEVADSKRQATSHRSGREKKQHSSIHEKQNYDASNFTEDKLKKSAKSQGKLSKSKHGKSTNEKTRSTISLSRVRNGSKCMEMRTDKIEKSMKMLWECIGELWENSRVSQYRSQKNSENLNKVKRTLEEQEQKILLLKFELNRQQNRNPPLRS